MKWGVPSPLPQIPIKTSEKVLFEVKIEKIKSKKNILALMLEGLHFNVLLGISWIKKANAIVNAD